MVFTILESGNANGTVYVANTTFFPIIGARAFQTTDETVAQYHVYDTLTWADFLLRVSVNDAAGATTMRTKINTGNGNASISVASAATGEFDDTVNSDALVDGDLINYELVRGAGGVNWRLSYFSTTFENATQGINYLIGRLLTMNAALNTRFQIITTDTQLPASEIETEITFNFAADIDRLRINMQVNTFTTGQLETRSRINQGNGNLILEIPNGMTGEFEDVVNSDSIVSGDEVDLRHVENSAAGSTTFSTQVRMIGDANNAYMRSHVAVDALNDGDTRFTLLEGSGHPSSESTSQMTVRATEISINNLFIRVVTNTLTVATTVVNRINGANGSLSISIASVATGYFEDIGPEDTIGIGDNGNTSMSAPAGANSLSFTALGVQLAEVPIGIGGGGVGGSGALLLFR